MPEGGAPAAALRIGGLTRLSLSDWPDKLAAVVFCQGCPWRCGYCHNPHLLAPRGEEPIDWHSVKEFLARRRGLLDAVVFSGGEPTLQRGLAAAMREAKGMGFGIGLHTAGIYPRRLQRVLPLVDWVAMDIKAPFTDYDSVTGLRNTGVKALASLELILASGIDYEFRTTVHPSLLKPEALVALAQALAHAGVRNYALQEFRGRGCSDTKFEGHHPSYLVESFYRPLQALFSSFVVRHA